MSSDLPSNTKLVFLVGAPRSGTTWLQLLLSSSPMIATSAETHLFSRYTGPLFWDWDFLSAKQGELGLHRLLEEHEYFEVIRQFTSSIFLKILRQKNQANVILEKTPSHAIFSENILRVYPDAYFIHLIRDPRAVIASLMAGFGSEDKSSRFSYFSTAKRISDFSRLWVKTVRKAREIGHRTDKYIEVFYRDLKQTGVQTLKRLFHWCDIAVSEIEITEMLKEQSIHRLRVAESAGLADEYRRVGKDFFRNGEIEGWRSDLTRWQIALIEHLTADLMRELGYRRETVGPWGSSIGAAAALPGWVCAGLVWRLEEYASLLGPPWT